MGYSGRANQDFRVRTFRQIQKGMRQGRKKDKKIEKQAGGQTDRDRNRETDR